jgi:DNA-binding Lrp family transcriptional regulator
VAAGYLGERTRWLLAERGIGYADRTGNLRLASERPVLYLERSGARRDPSPDTRPIRTLRGSSSGRAVRALLDHAPPYGVRALAQRAGVSAATLSRVVELLEREAIAVRERARGPVTALVGSNRTATYLDPRGGFAASRLRGSSARYAVTGSAAAAVVAPVAVPRLTAVYVPSIEAAAEGWSLQRAETGGNVLLVEPCDGVVFERTTRRDGVTHAALGQVAIDLMTGPGRGPAEADALIAWMAAHEGEWRG